MRSSLRDHETSPQEWNVSGGVKKNFKAILFTGCLRKLKTDSIEREIEHLSSTAKRREMEEKDISHLLWFKMRLSLSSHLYFNMFSELSKNKKDISLGKYIRRLWINSVFQRQNTFFFWEILTRHICGTAVLLQSWIYTACFTTQ